MLAKLISQCNLKTLSLATKKKKLWQTARMIVSPIMVDNFASLFNCTTVGGSQTK